MKIAYEPHPVTPERKAELRAAGFKIIDAVFKPAESVSALDVGEGATDANVGAVEAPVVRRGRPRKAKG